MDSILTYRKEGADGMGNAGAGRHMSSLPTSSSPVSWVLSITNLAAPRPLLLPGLLAGGCGYWTSETQEARLDVLTLTPAGPPACFPPLLPLQIAIRHIQSLIVGFIYTPVSPSWNVSNVNHSATLTEEMLSTQLSLGLPDRHSLMEA